MKKLLSVLCALCLLLGMAHADVLTLDLSSATDDELAQAMSMIQAEQRARMVTKIQLSDSQVTLTKGKAQRITAAVVDLPEGVKEGKFVWSTSDKTVATCANGNITAVNAGTATITCAMKLSDGTELDATCVVTVVIPVASVTAASKKLDLGVDQTAHVAFTVKPDNASTPKLSYTSSAPSVATVDEDGNVTGVGIGTATITGSAVDGSGKSATCNVVVTKKDDVGVTKTNGDGIAITLLSHRTSKGSNYFKPESGNVFVLPMFELVNNGKSDASISSLMCFTAYCDGYKLSYSFSAACAEKNGLDGELPAGKKMKGEYGMEVPADWKELEVHIETSWFTDTLVFVIYNQ